MIRQFSIPSTAPGVLQMGGYVIQKPPWEWNREEVSEWLHHCEEEFALDRIDLTRFAMNGKALYLLSKQDFIDRVPSIGDVLFSCLQHVLEEARRSFMCSPSTKYYDGVPYHQHQTNAYDSPRMLNGDFCSRTQQCEEKFSPPSPSYLVPSQHGTKWESQLVKRLCSTEIADSERPENLVVGEREMCPRYSDITMTPPLSTNFSDPDHAPTSQFMEEQPANQYTSKALEQNGESNTQKWRKEDSKSNSPAVNGGVKKNSESRLLWDFLRNLLKNGTAPKCIRWLDEDNSVFRIYDASGLATLWGQQKNRQNMTYEKMSRALRYYYKMNIIQKVKGKRLTYRFSTRPDEIKKGRGQHPSEPLRAQDAGDGELSPCVSESAPKEQTFTENCAMESTSTCKSNETNISDISFDVNNQTQVLKNDWRATSSKENCHGSLSSDKPFG